MEQGETVASSTAADAALAALEETLTLVVRHARLPRLHHRIVSAAGLHMDPGVYHVLCQLSERGPLQPTQVAEGLCVSPSTASRQLRQAEEGNLVVRSAHPRDARSSLLRLTCEGERTLRRLVEARRMVLSEVLGEWSTEDVTDLAALLSRLGADLIRFLYPRPEQL